MMKVKALETSPPYYLNYINKVDDKPLLEVLKTGGIELFEQHIDQLEALGQKVYAPGKWTAPDIIQHVMDTERIFINRALRFVRQDLTELPGYDHNSYVPIARANDRTVKDLLEEYKALRLSSYLFFKHLNEEELLRKGTANGVEISVIAIGYILIGHPIHHFNVIRERYFGL